MWRETPEGLYKKFEFADFRAAFGFMTEVAKLAEGQQHHPKWTNEYNKVEIWLSTHDVNGQITDKDRALSEAIDQL